MNFVDRWGLHAEDPAFTYRVEETADYREVWATTWLASTEVSYTREVSRSASEVVLQHVYRHSHQYQYINLRSERRVRPDGYEYWELVKDIEYTYWRTIEHSEEWETIDLIGPKRQDLVEGAGAVPLIGWGATEIVRYLVEPPAPVQRHDQQEVLAPDLPHVSDEEAYRALYELASFVGWVATGIAVGAAVAGSAGTLGVALGVSLGAGATAEAALVAEGFETGEWETLAGDFARTTLGLAFGQLGVEAYYAGRIGEALTLWLFGLLTGIRSSEDPTESASGTIGPPIPEP